MKLSVIYSIYNRSKLFSIGLKSILSQQFDLRDVEIIVVDDNSTEDIKTCLEPLSGQIKVKYIKYDHTLSPLYNKDGPWYHTQAISANIGIKQATGDIICISQPEMIHSPFSFETGCSIVEKEGSTAFGEILQAKKLVNEYIDLYPNADFDEILLAASYYKEWEYNHQPLTKYEMYWYIMYFPTRIALEIGGVDLDYQKGVYAEDDQFRIRMQLAGYPAKWGGRPYLSGPVDKYIIGIHQNHSDEGLTNPQQNRAGEQWKLGAERNRELYRKFLLDQFIKANQGLDFDPWHQFCITDMVEL